MILLYYIEERLLGSSVWGSLRGEAPHKLQLGGVWEGEGEALPHPQRSEGARRGPEHPGGGGWGSAPWGRASGDRNAGKTHKSLTKTQIKYVLENLFNVSITQVNTCNLPTKTRRVGRFVGKRPNYKKAYVKLKEGDTINDLFN